MNTPTNTELAAAFSLEHGGPNPYFRCRVCGMTEPGLHEYLVQHYQQCHPEPVSSTAAPPC